jgi:hypothetical protein
LEDLALFWVGIDHAVGDWNQTLELLRFSEVGQTLGPNGPFFSQEENDETIISVAQKEQLKQDLFFKKWRMAWDGKPFLQIGQEKSGFNMSEKLNI